MVRAVHGHIWKGRIEVMKKIFSLAFAFLISLTTVAQRQESNQNSSVTFAIKNMGLTVEGSFRGLKGSIEFDPNELSSSRFNVVLNANTIDTGIELRNKHLQKEEYLDVANFAEIGFVSTKIETWAQSGKYKVTGKLTIKKVTKEVIFDFTAQKQNIGHLLKGEFSIDRRDYGVGGNSFSMADDVRIFLSVKSTLDKT